jgi:hypothetical protein
MPTRSEHNHRACLTGAIVTSLLIAAPVSAGTVIDLSEVRVPTLVGSMPGEQFGYTVALGDIDGDGAAELVVGAPGHTADGELRNAGAVYIFDRTTNGAPPVGRADARALATIIGDSQRGRLGMALAVADLNGDGLDDIVAGAPDEGSTGTVACGRVYVFLSSPGRPASGNASARADLVMVGEASGDRLGSSLLVADTDADGRAELFASAFRAGDGSGTGSGTVYLVRGEALQSTPDAVGVAELASLSIRGEGLGDGLRSVAVADTDGDGRLETILGSYLADAPGAAGVDVGKIYVLDPECTEHGGVLALPGPASTVIAGVAARGFLGRSISSGDIDSDGFDDLLVSAYAAGDDPKRLEAWGEVFVLFGAREGPAADLGVDGVPRFRGKSRYDLFGLPTLLQDLNGDATPDIIAAAQFAAPRGGSRPRSGEVYVSWGSLRSVVEAKAGNAESADVTVVGALEHDGLGGALAVADIVGGSEPDLIIGAPEGSSEDVPGDLRTGKLYVIPAELLLSSE